MENTKVSERVKDVKVPVEVVIGRRELTIEQLSSLGEGTIIELESLAGEPVELVAAGRLIARGEVVVIEERFGIRITELSTKRSR